MNKKIPKPTESELAILRVLWERGPSSVKEVNAQLNAQRDPNSKEIGYTTTLKLMQIMFKSDRQLVSRNEESRTHIYEANVKEADMQQKLLNKFVESTFGGSAMQMVMQALGNHTASKEELSEIKALIDRIEKGG